MFNYELIFRNKEHYITIPQRHSRKLYFGSDYLHKLLKHQQVDENFFITKYAEDGIVSCIILDFDDENESHTKAYRDAKRVKKFTHRKGLNTVIVSSTNKGYHTYIQIPPRAFGNSRYSHPNIDRNIWFNKFVDYIIAKRKFGYPTLDSTNTSAGLRGNIRIIGSVHPKTQEKVHIVDGEFLDFVEPCDWEWDCLQRSLMFAESEVKINEIHKKEKIKEFREKKHNGQELIDNNDLRILMPQIFGGDVKSFKKGYIMMTCPFHSPDEHPSMVVEKDYFYCKACGQKGNWWTLQKMGYVHLPKQEFLRVKTMEKVRL